MSDRKQASRRQNLTRRAAMWLAALLSMPAPSQGVCTYSVTVIPEMDCGGWQTPISPIAINNSGVVLLVGGHCGPGTPLSFWWSGQKELQPIPLPSGITQMRGYDLNDAGLVVGEMGGPAGQFGFVFDLNTQQFIAQIPPPTPNGICGLTGINQTGFACGWQRTVAGEPNTSTAFIYEIATGELTDLGTLGGESSTAVAINNLNAVAGIVTINGLPQTFLWQSGKLTIIEPLFDFTSGPSGLNDDGVIAGAASYLIPTWPFQLSTAFQWNNGHTTNLGMLPGDTDSTVRDINQASVIVGTSRYLSMSKTIWRGVIWIDGALYDLTDFIVGMPASTVTFAYAINDSGHIAARLFTSGQENDVAAVVLTPIAKTGDITGNCAVDVDDLLRVINEWGDSNSVADLDESGIVDAPDLMIVIENWSIS